jgi:hypothetical protein
MCELCERECECECSSISHIKDFLFKTRTQFIVYSNLMHTLRPTLGLRTCDRSINMAAMTAPPTRPRGRAMSANDGRGLGDAASTEVTTNFSRGAACAPAGVLLGPRVARGALQTREGDRLHHHHDPPLPPLRHPGASRSSARTTRGASATSSSPWRRFSAWRRWRTGRT